MVGYLELMLMEFHLAQLLILLVLLKFQELVHTLLMVVDSSILQVRQDFLYSPVYLVEVYSNLKVHLSPTLVYLLLVMDTSMECMVKVQKVSALNTLVMVHLENLVVLLNLLPSIQMRSRCYSPSVEHIQVSALLMVYGKVMVNSSTLVVEVKEFLMTTLVLVPSSHSTNLRKQELTSTTVVLLFHSWILIMDWLLIVVAYQLLIYPHRQSLLMKLHQQELSELVLVK